MSLENNKELVRRFIDEVMNAGNTTAIADFFNSPGSYHSIRVRYDLRSANNWLADKPNIIVSIPATINV